MNGNISTQEKKDGHSLRVLNPVAILKFTPLSPAKRLKDLKNKKIGLYWNNKARGDAVLNRLKELLSYRFNGMGFEWFESGPMLIGKEEFEEWFENIKKSGVEGVIGTTGD